MLYQTKNGSVGLVRLVDEAQRVLGHLVVDGLHALLGQRAGVLDLLAALAVGPAVQHAARPEVLLELRVLRIVRILRLFLGVEVIEIAEELVEAVQRRQILVLVAEVVLAELAGGVAERLEQFGDRRIFRLQADIGAGHADLGQPGADRVLAGDERGAAGRAALLAVVVGEGHALVGDAVDVGRAVAHLAAAVVADVPPADVVAPEDEDVRFFRWHGLVLSVMTRIPGASQQPGSKNLRPLLRHRFAITRLKAEPGSCRRGRSGTSCRCHRGRAGRRLAWHLPRRPTPSRRPAARSCRSSCTMTLKVGPVCVKNSSRPGHR